MTTILTTPMGSRRYDETEMPEPPIASVVLTSGLSGSAWQRLAIDGLWHCARRGRPKTWEQLLTMRNVFLVHEAPPR